MWAVFALAGAAFVIGAAVGAFHAPEEQRVAERFADAWRRGDYTAMRAEISDAGRARATAKIFRRAYEVAATTATATKLTIGKPRKDGDVYVLPVSVATRIFGTFRNRVVLPISGKGSKAKIDWRANLAFPGLGPGERLQRTTEMPPRAGLLARDGTPLAQGPSRTSPLGETARAAAGDLGPIPEDRAEELRALGVPDGTQVGTSGLERIFDTKLLGTPGGRLMAGTTVLAQRPPVRAHDLRTTIAPKVQEAAIAALAGRYGGVVALKPGTGEILAFAGIPFSGLQPPGSTMKIVTLTGALQAKIAGPSSTYPYATEATISGVKLANANGESCGGTLTQAFAISCNSVFAPLGAKLGAKKLVATAEKFGFNGDPGLPGAAMSVIPQADTIGDDLAVGSSAIGQGVVQATTLQMTRVAATIALGGRKPGLTLERAKLAKPGPRLFPASVASAVRKMMVGVVTGGTGRSAQIAGVSVAGKTGTAELKTTHPCEPDPENPEACPEEDQVNDPTDTDAWFVAFAPSAKPRVVVGVLLVASGAGGDTAAPAARGVMAAALKSGA